MTKQADGLEARISELESTIAQLRGETPAKKSPRVGRRKMLGLAAAAVGGGIAAPLMMATTASANNGNAIIIGNSNFDNGGGVNNNAGLSTFLSQTTDASGNQTRFVVKHQVTDPAPNINTFFHDAPILGVGSSGGEGVSGYAEGASGWGVYGTANAGVAMVGHSRTGIDFLGVGTGRVVMTSTGASGTPGYAGGFWEQVRDVDGAMYMNVGSNGTWAPAMVGGLGVAWFESVITNQPQLVSSNGVGWTALGSNLGTTVKVTFTTPFRCKALCTANVDLWTDTAGYNQDVGIFYALGGSANPTNLVAWKESGGFAGTFSPNAAFCQGSVDLASGTQYTFSLQWKTNRNAPGVTIYAGAGPLSGGPGSGQFSPTRMIVQLIPR